MVQGMDSDAAGENVIEKPEPDIERLIPLAMKHSHSPDHHRLCREDDCPVVQLAAACRALQADRKRNTTTCRSGRRRGLIADGEERIAALENDIRLLELAADDRMKRIAALEKALAEAHVEDCGCLPATAGSIALRAKTDPRCLALRAGKFDERRTVKCRACAGDGYHEDLAGVPTGKCKACNGTGYVVESDE